MNSDDDHTLDSAPATTTTNAAGQGSRLTSQWNYAVPLLTMSFKRTMLSTGSGFFWRRGLRTYLVTNWHNLSGRNPATLELVSKTTGAVPDEVGMSIFHEVGEPVGELIQMQIGTLTVDLSHNDKPTWREHPLRAKGVDVATLDITRHIPAESRWCLRCANEIEGDAVIEPTAGQDVFVLGYPFGRIVGAPVPIWKRGTIAIDPSFDVDGLPKMLVDTATREGMSGSPVIARHILNNREFRRKNGERAKFLYAKRDLVIGVYSGRLFPHREQAQLGTVWKREVIEETIDGDVVPAMEAG
jgi:hypothetical protein